MRLNRSRRVQTEGFHVLRFRQRRVGVHHPKEPLVAEADKRVTIPRLRAAGGNVGLDGLADLSPGEGVLGQSYRLCGQQVEVLAKAVPVQTAPAGSTVIPRLQQQRATCCLWGGSSS